MATSERIHQMTIMQWEKAFPDEDACCAYLVAHRWPDKVVICPRCGNDAVHPVGTMDFRWQCYQCSPTGYRFSHLVGTVFENTNYPLRTWFRVVHMMLTSKKGVSALQVHRVIGTGSYRTAWSMCHRIRAGLANEDFRKLMGIVEVDETFVGGKSRNRHKSKRGPDSKGGGIGSGKTPVVGAVQRKGNIVARVIDTVSADILTAFVQETVSNKVSLLVTDEWKGYGRLKKEYPHGVIKHASGEYVNGAIHTNTIEGFLVDLQARHRRQLPQGQQEVLAAVRRGIPVPVQQPAQPGHLR